MKSIKQENYSQEFLKGSFLRNKKEIIMLGIFLAMLAFIVSAFLSPKFKAFSSIIINQRSSIGMDAYREAKSSEFMARTTKEVVLSNSFMKEVLNQEEIAWQEINKINQSDEKVKFWRKRVNVAVVPNTGIMNISVYTRDKLLSKRLLEKIVSRLAGSEKTLFAGKNIKIAIINEPYYFTKPASPKLLLNSILGFVMGVLLAMILIFLGKEDFLSVFKFRKDIGLSNNSTNKKKKQTRK